MSDAAQTQADDKPVSFNMNIRDGRTEIRVSGDRDTSVIVYSMEGTEKIYLPPEDFDREAEQNQGAYDSPYRSGSGAQDSPYDTHPDAGSVTGLEPTADGYIINHPEPVKSVQFLR